MKEKFFKMFKRYEKRAIMPGFRSVVQAVMSALDTGKMQSAKNFLVGLRDDMSRLYNDGGCDSGLIMQFEENLYRAAAYLPPLQEDNKIHPYLKIEKKSEIE